jgi:hypothetical protein
MSLVDDQAKMKKRWSERKRNPVTKKLMAAEDFEKSEIQTLMERTDLVCPMCKKEPTTVSKFSGEIKWCKRCKTRDGSFKQNYGITLRDYYKRVYKQLGRCAICMEHKGDSLFVDYCHELGHWRGLLCSTCNTMLGLAKDNEDILHNAASYIKNNVLSGGWCSKSVGGDPS